jgi:D-sedoheptulose 7-phosphate isomerase
VRGALEERERILRDFLANEKSRIALACHSMARAFARGGTLLAYGTGAAETDAAHIAVEFMHPVIVGKRALPALAPPNDVFALMRPGDIAVGIEEDAARFLEQARARELLTISFDAGPADFAFAVPATDPHLRQEVHETTYHVLWELVHVFFEHPGLLDEACITCGDVAVEAEVVAVADGTAVIEKDGVREEIAVDLVERVEIGDTLLCHAGVALEKL